MSTNWQGLELSAVCARCKNMYTYLLSLLSSEALSQVQNSCLTIPFPWLCNMIGCKQSQYFWIYTTYNRCNMQLFKKCWHLRSSKGNTKPEKDYGSLCFTLCTINQLGDSITCYHLGSLSFTGQLLLKAVFENNSAHTKVSLWLLFQKVQHMFTKILILMELRRKRKGKWTTLYCIQRKTLMITQAFNTFNQLIFFNQTTRNFYLKKRLINSQI